MRKNYLRSPRKRFNPKPARVSHLLAEIMPIVLVAVIWLQTAGTLGQEKERPPFGSSLEKLNWNPKTRKVIDSNPKKKRQPAEAGGDKGEITLETTLAAFDVLVTDKQNKVVSGLTKDDFLVTEDNVPQQVGTCSQGNDVNLPRSIVLVIDYSGSQLPYIETSVDSAKILINQLGPKDKMAIVTDDVR